MDRLLLDLLGVFAFSVLGAAKALRQRFNVSGIILCAFLTALAGGTIREIILGHTPHYFSNYVYISVVVLSAILTILFWRWFDRFEKYVLVLDAVGLAVFAYIGATTAWSAQLGLVAMVAFAIVTAAGGGIITDSIAGIKPAALTKDFYIPPAILMAFMCAVLGETARSTPAAYILISLIAIVRLCWLYTARHKRKIKNRLLLLLSNMRLGAIFGHD